MTANRLAHLLAGAACTVLLSTGASAQTPVPNTVPKLTLSWLSGLNISPSTVTVTSTTGAEMTATVLLLRPAVAPLTVNFSLTGARTDESGVLVADNLIMPYRLIIPAGSSSGSVKVAAAKTAAGPTRSYTLTASYGTESKSGTITVNRR